MLTAYAFGVIFSARVDALMSHSSNSRAKSSFTSSTRPHGWSTSRRRTPPAARWRPRRWRICVQERPSSGPARQPTRHLQRGAVKIRCRPRVTHHGEATKTAVS